MSLTLRPSFQDLDIVPGGPSCSSLLEPAPFSLRLSNCHGRLLLLLLEASSFSLLPAKGRLVLPAEFLRLLLRSLGRLALLLNHSLFLLFDER